MPCMPLPYSNWNVHAPLFGRRVCFCFLLWVEPYKVRLLETDSVPIGCSHGAGSRQPASDDNPCWSDLLSGDLDVRFHSLGLSWSVDWDAPLDLHWLLSDRHPWVEQLTVCCITKISWLLLVPSCLHKDSSRLRVAEMWQIWRSMRF